MGMGYALSEKLPLKDGRLTSERMSKLGLPKAKDIPEIKAIGVECADPMGPFGAKGVGEIVCIPDGGGHCQRLLPIRRFAAPPVASVANEGKSETENIEYRILNINIRYSADRCCEDSILRKIAV